MSLLSDRIRTAVADDLAERGRTEPAAVAAVVVETLTPEEMKECALRDITLQAKRMAQRGVKKVAEAPTQASLPFPGLRAGYAIDVDERCIKNTEDLTRLEFQRLISIREQQIEADRDHLSELRAAQRAVRPIWDAHPDWTFRQVSDAYMALAPRTKAA